MKRKQSEREKEGRREGNGQKERNTLVTLLRIYLFRGLLEGWISLLVAGLIEIGVIQRRVVEGVRAEVGRNDEARSSVVDSILSSLSIL